MIFVLVSLREGAHFSAENHRRSAFARNFRFKLVFTCQIPILVHRKPNKVHDDSSTGFDPKKCAKNAVLDALTLLFDT